MIERSPKIGVIGAGGMIGGALSRLLAAKGLPFHGWTREELDITSEASIRAALDTTGIGVLVNCAAYTAVDRAESEPEKAHAVNAEGAGLAARQAAARGIPFVHISTDYVFGRGGKDTALDEETPVSPTSVYGKTKAEGESAVRAASPAHVIVRTSWLYAPFGRNFVRSIFEASQTREVLKVVNDQFGNPTSVGDLVEALTHILTAVASRGDTFPWGTYHVAGHPAANWHELATCVVDHARKYVPIQTRRVEPIATSQWPTAAARPLWSVLNLDKARDQLQIELPPWTSAVGQVVRELASACTTPR